MIWVTWTRDGAQCIPLYTLFISITVCIGCGFPKRNPWAIQLFIWQDCQDMEPWWNGICGNIVSIQALKANILHLIYCFCSTDPISFYCSMHIQVLLNTVHDAVPLSMTLCSRYGNGRHIVKLYWGIYGRHDVSIVIIAIQVWSSEWYLIHWLPGQGETSHWGDER